MRCIVLHQVFRGSKGNSHMVPVGCKEYDGLVFDNFVRVWTVSIKDKGGKRKSNKNGY